MNVAKSFQMRNIDQFTINNIGIPGIVLMENAALKVTQSVLELLEHKKINTANILLLCGTGNNGGDGFAVARQLFQKGIDIKIVVIGSNLSIKGDAKINFDVLKNLNIDVIEIEVNKSCDINIISELAADSDIIIDAIFGTGLSRNVNGFYCNIFDVINKCNADVVSVDIPSGVDGDGGKICGGAIQASYTVSFQLPKIGNLLYPGAAYNGRLSIVDIGIPNVSVEQQDIKVSMIDLEEIKGSMKKRNKNSHKGTYGRVGVLSGSKGMSGAAVLNCRGALISGSGLVRACVSQDIYSIVESCVIEATTYTFDENHINYDYINENLLNYADVVATGSGCTNLSEYCDILQYLIRNYNSTLVIDAEGINIISKNKEMLLNHKQNIVLTPHCGEMARLINKDIKYIEENLIDVAMDFAVEYNVYLILKGAKTVIAAPDGYIYINTTGNPGMATAGSGDVLTGIVASFIGQKIDIVQALKLAVYAHGLSGDIGVEEKGENSLTAGDLIKYLPCALKRISMNNEC